MLRHGDLFDVLPTVAEASIDAGVTDPPYGIGFMGKEWDSFKPEQAAKKQGLRQLDKSPAWRDGDRRLIDPNLKGRTVNGAISSSQIEYDRSLVGQHGFQEWTERWAREVFRVLKPGAYLLVCGAPRSFHRMTCGLEDAGFEIRDCLSWLYGQGFPKSLNLGEGQGTALKPGWEPIVLARKPVKTTIAENLGTFGTGCLQIDACRLNPGLLVSGGGNGKPSEGSSWKGSPRSIVESHDLGRWPANVVLDEAAAQLLDLQSGAVGGGDSREFRGGRRSGFGNVGAGVSHDSNPCGRLYDDLGGASRFFYVAKPSREERDYGCESLAARTGGEATNRTDGTAGLNNPRAGAGRTGGGRNFHPTVKPIELMRWLVRLVTPIGGTVIDPFTGSGTTGMACRYEQREFIGIEREAEYVTIAEARIAACLPLLAV